jgi:hypothetical protein
MNKEKAEQNVQTDKSRTKFLPCNERMAEIGELVVRKRRFSVPQRPYSYRYTSEEIIRICWRKEEYIGGRHIQKQIQIGMVRGVFQFGCFLKVFFVFLGRCSRRRRRRGGGGRLSDKLVDDVLENRDKIGLDNIMNVDNTSREEVEVVGFDEKRDKGRSNATRQSMRMNESGDDRPNRPGGRRVNRRRKRRGRGRG